MVTIWQPDLPLVELEGEVCSYSVASTGRRGKEGGKEGGREGGREGSSKHAPLRIAAASHRHDDEGRKEGGREGGREGRRERKRTYLLIPTKSMEVFHKDVPSAPYPQLEVARSA